MYSINIKLNDRDMHKLINTHRVVLEQENDTYELIKSIRKEERDKLEQEYRAVIDNLKLTHMIEIAKLNKEIDRLKVDHKMKMDQTITKYNQLLYEKNKAIKNYEKLVSVIKSSMDV